MAKKRTELLSARTTYLLGATLIVFGFAIRAVYFLHLPERFRSVGATSVRPVVTSTLLSFDVTTSTAVHPEFTASTTYRLIIPRIGVDMPIVVNEPNEAKGLAAGAWQILGTASPDNSGGYGNMVLSAHRYLYTSGPNTFFDLDKLEVGDKIIVWWQGKMYSYTVDASKVVPPSAVEILNPSPTPELTLFTCTPVFTTKNRLVVTARPS